MDLTNAISSQKAFKFELKGMSVDVLVTGDLTQLSGLWPVFFDDLTERDRECWRVACTQKAVDFVHLISSKQPLAKAVVRIAKYWRDTVIGDWPVKSRPPSFLLELLVFHALGSKECDFIECGFIEFLRCVGDFKSLYVTWSPEWFEDDQLPEEVLIDEPPLVLDPTDPHNNVAKRVELWEVLANKAAVTLKQIDTTPAAHGARLRQTAR